MSCLTRIAAGAAAILALASFPAHAQLPVDDLRVRQLETELMRLQRTVEDQARRIQWLEQAARMVSPSTPLPIPESAPSQNSSPSWLVAASWDRIRTGMTPQQVMAVLGRPTSTRNAEDGKLRLMYYAMELGPDTYLSGTIRLDDTGVVEINRPALK